MTVLAEHKKYETPTLVIKEFKIADLFANVSSAVVDLPIILF